MEEGYTAQIEKLIKDYNKKLNDVLMEKENERKEFERKACLTEVK